MTPENQMAVMTAVALIAAPLAAVSWGTWHVGREQRRREAVLSQPTIIRLDESSGGHEASQ